MIGNHVAEDSGENTARERVQRHPDPEDRAGDAPRRDDGACGFAEEATEDVCLLCGAHIGFGLPVFHLEICDDCGGTSGDLGDMLVERAGHVSTLADRVAGDEEAVAAACRRIDLLPALRWLIGRLEELHAVVAAARSGSSPS